MAELGSLALLIALVLCAYSFVVGLVALLDRSEAADRLSETARRAGIAAFAGAPCSPLHRNRAGDLCERQKTNSQRYRLFILRLLPAAMAFRTLQVMCRAFQAQFEAVRIIMNFGFSSVSLDLM